MDGGEAKWPEMAWELWTCLWPPPCPGLPAGGKGPCRWMVQPPERPGHQQVQQLLPGVLMPVGKPIRGREVSARVETLR